MSWIAGVAWPFLRGVVLPGAVAHWKYVVIGAAVLIIAGEGCLLRSGWIEQGRQQQVILQKEKENGELRQAFVAESVRADANEAKFRVDTLRMTRVLARTDTLRDSLIIHLTDTVRVKEFIQQSDADRKVCTETVRSCEAVQADLRAQITTLKSQVVVAAPRVDTVKTSRCGWAGAVGAGFVYDLRDARGHVGPTAVLGAGCHF